MIDHDIIDTAFKSICNFGADDLMPHLIYCGMHYFYSWERIALEEMILTQMRKYGIQSSILTMLKMSRRNLVTKETVEKAVQGKMKSAEEPGWITYRGPINDDLEEFFIDIHYRREVKCENASSFFTPKLTNEELKLVQEGEKEYMNSYLDHFNGRNPDVDVEEMKKSDSKSKYVHGDCRRWTIPLTVETSQFDDETEDEVPESSPCTKCL